MFTGIVQAIGTVERLEMHAGDARLRLSAGAMPLAGTVVGDSIAVNGVCLTVTEIDATGFMADVSGATLACTTLRHLRHGDRVNLERALALGDRLGGHLVSGHVDGIATVCDRRPAARSVQFQLQAPLPLAKYIAAKGSICLDGVSLTVNAVDGVAFDVNVVPHTLSVTTLDRWAAATEVNLEVDLLARYLERLVSRQPGEPVTQELLARTGFIRR